MIIVNTNEVHGHTIVETLGMVRGSSVRARSLAKDVMAGMKNIVGGEIDEYTKLIAESREQAFDRMVAQAQALGANAVVCVRFASSEITPGAAEVLAYGTAVKLL